MQNRSRVRRRGRPHPALLRPAPARRSPWMRAILAGVLGLIALMFLTLGTAAGAAYGAYTDLADSLKPRLEAISTLNSFQTTRLYDRNGTLLYEFFGAGKRTRVPYEDISTTLISATVAIEDQTFFENQGVDVAGMARTLWSSLQAGEVTGGASTITQQLIKTVVLNDEERAYANRVQRKVTEIILAQELTDRYTKEEILALYLNEIYYGNLAYGIEAASNVYFDRSARDLTLEQAALLAGLPQLPSIYDPYNFLDNNALKGIRLEDGWLESAYELPTGTPPPKWRQIAVLRQMVEEGYVTDQQARQAAANDLQFATREVPLNAPHFVFYVRRELEERFGPQFASLGLSIYTTLDLDLQRMAQQQAAERIEELKERNIHNASVVILQPNTGQILAMVGSIDYNKVEATTTPGEKGNVIDGQVNVAVRLRQPGSALKPFTYLAAMERGWTPETVIWDVPTKFPLLAGEWYAPQNYNGKWNGPVRMRTALANSLNMPAVKALKFAGIDYTIELLRRLGIRSLDRGEGFYGLALTLGGGEVTPLELTAAYNTLASGGRYYPPVSILRVEDGRGRILEQFQPVLRPVVIDPNLAAIITNMLNDDRARQPVWGLNSKLKLSRPAAVKTGTSNDWRDAWAVGYTPYVTVGVWTGNNNNEPTSKVESLTGGGTIWHNIMEAMFRDPKFTRLLAEPYNGDRIPFDFTLPPTLLRAPLCTIPGPYGNYAQELMTPEMLRRTGLTALPANTTPTPTPVPIDGAPPVASSACDLYRSVTVIRVTDVVEPVVLDSTGLTTTTLMLPTDYCKPVAGQIVDPARIVTLLTWNFPPPDPDEEIEYRWEAMATQVEGQIVSQVDPNAIPDCTDAVLAALPTPTPEALPPAAGTIQMPDLIGLNEEEARNRLNALGVTNIFVDYQGRDRIPDVFDRYPPYTVVSTLPNPGEWFFPEATVVMGVRAP